MDRNTESYICLHAACVMNKKENRPTVKNNSHWYFLFRQNCFNVPPFTRNQIHIVSLCEIEFQIILMFW